MTDEQLYQQCIYYGAEAKKWRNKFLGLLGEVYRRELFRKKGFNSIHEFASKLAGVTHAQTDEAIRIEKQIKEKSVVLHKALMEGDIGMYKIARIASVITKENEEILYSQAQLLSRRGLDQLVKDIKQNKKLADTAQITQLNLDAANTTSAADAMMSAHDTHVIDASENIAQSLSGQENSNEYEFSQELKNRLTAMKNKGIDLDAALTEALDLWEEKIRQEKDKLAAEQNIKPTVSRHIPARIRRLLKKEHGTRCAKTGCIKPAKHIHHARRYSLDSSHDPYYLAPLCEAHHEIAHAIDLKVQKRKWRL